MMWILFLILCLASTDSRSLEFRSFGLKVASGQMHIREQILFDEVPVSYCDSFKKDSTLFGICEKTYEFVYYSFNDIQQLVNITDVIQRQRGCVNSTNGTVSAFEKWAVSGIEFLTFEPDSLKWTSQSPTANPVEQSWNKREWNHEFSNFLKEQCPSMMQDVKLTSTDQNTDVRIFAKPIPNTAKVSLRCHVTSSDRSLKVYLTGDGAPMVNQVGPLPTGDGAVIFRRTAEIFINQDRKYVCTVQTRNNNFSTFWDGHTLDGSRITIQVVAPEKWISLPNLTMMVLSFGAVALIIVGLCCCMNLLLKMVKVKRTPAPSVDSRLREQSIRLIRDAIYPVIRNVIAAYLFGSNLPEEHEEAHQRWVEMNSMREASCYVPDYFGPTFHRDPEEREEGDFTEEGRHETQV